MKTILSNLITEHKKLTEEIKKLKASILDEQEKNRVRGVSVVSMEEHLKEYENAISLLKERS